MGKYQPLGDYLRKQANEEVAMRFEEIERIVGSKLPEKSQLYRAWWSNNPSNNVMTKVWLDAGYQTAQVDMAGRRLVFRRAHPSKASESTSPAPAVAPETGQRAASRRHPLFGALKGLLRVMPETDLTKPADPTWGET
jgi:hypothetical protein